MPEVGKIYEGVEGAINGQPKVAPRVTASLRVAVIPSCFALPISVAKGNKVALRITTKGGYFRRRSLKVLIIKVDYKFTLNEGSKGNLGPP